MPKQKNAGTVDPTLPFTPIVIGGETYKMCLDYQALAEAEESLNRRGIEAKLLLAMPRLKFWSVRLIFAASLQHYHPELPYADALKLVTPATLWPIADAIADAWHTSVPEPAAEAGKDATTDPL